MADKLPPTTDCPACNKGRKTIRVLDTARDSEGRQAGRTVEREVECDDCGGAGEILGGPPV